MVQAKQKYVTVEVITSPSRPGDGVPHRHYRLYYGDRDRNMLANGMDCIWVRRETKRSIDVKMSDVRRKPRKVSDLIGDRGLKFLKALTSDHRFLGFDALCIVSSWQIDVPFPKDIIPTSQLDDIILSAIGKTVGMIPRRRPWR